LRNDAKKDNNEALILIYKSVLINLYGRFGLTANNLEYKIIDNNKLDKILHTENADLIFKSNRLSLVRSYGSYDNEFIKLINKNLRY
jgi:hypothetical protein